MTLQQFAERYVLHVKNNKILGPRGRIIEIRGSFNVMYGNQFQLFNPCTQAKHAIEAIGLKYTPPPDVTTFLIVKEVDGWYMTAKMGPYKTRELTRLAKECLKTIDQETP